MFRGEHPKKRKNVKKVIDSLIDRLYNASSRDGHYLPPPTAAVPMLSDYASASNGFRAHTARTGSATHARRKSGTATNPYDPIN